MLFFWMHSTIRIVVLFIPVKFENKLLGYNLITDIGASVRLDGF